MVEYRREILGTIVIVVILIILKLILNRIIHKFGNTRSINPNRRKIINNIKDMVIYFLSIIVLAGVWGVDSKQLIVFISSILTILGIGFFAQWSILSNLTAGFILFFSHHLRIGDHIRIVDNDIDCRGEIIDIIGFFLHMKTEKGEKITWPNSFILQKGIEILED